MSTLEQILTLASVLAPGATLHVEAPATDAELYVVGLRWRTKPPPVFAGLGFDGPTVDVASSRLLERLRTVAAGELARRREQLDEEARVMRQLARALDAGEVFGGEHEAIARDLAEAAATRSRA